MERVRRPRRDCAASRALLFHARRSCPPLFRPQVVKHVARLREMSPLWEMKQQGIDIASINWSKH